MSSISDLRSGLIAICSQVNGIGTIYDAPPGQLEDNSVLLPWKGATPDPTQMVGKQRMHHEFDILHIFRDRKLEEVVPDMEALVSTWMTVLTRWGNLTLGGVAQDLTLKAIDLKTIRHNGQSYLALVITLDVLAEFSITP